MPVLDYEDSFMNFLTVCDCFLQVVLTASHPIAILLALEGRVFSFTSHYMQA